MRQSPYLIVSGGFGVETPEGRIVKARFLDPTKKDKIVSGGEMIAPNKSPWFSVGASQGWIMKYDGRNLYLTEAFKPWVSSPRVISLPGIPLSMPRNEIMSLSSSDPVQDDDCIVATKFDDLAISVCRPRRDSEWTHIGNLNCILPANTITYSKRYKAFYFTSPNGLYLGSVDLSNYKINHHHLRLRNLPDNIDKKWNKIHETCKMTYHLVDSPSGDLFFILWYTTYMTETLEDDHECVKETLIKLKRFMVFREDEKSKDFNYTDDIGDLCIFLGMNEAFSVPASMYPGLRPNSIYYTYPAGGPGIGCYSLASAKTRGLTTKSRIRQGTFWIHPADPIA